MGENEEEGDKKKENEVSDSEEKDSGNVKKEEDEVEEGSKKGRKEWVWISVVLGVSVLVLVVSTLWFQSLNSFEYEGLTFTKERFGEIPVFHYYYYQKAPVTGEVTSKYNLYLRVDPRENDVPIEGEINYLPGKFTYVSVDGRGLTECGMSSVGIASLSGFLADNGLRPRGASPILEDAEEANADHITCENKKERVVILIQEGEETKIEKVGERCHVISVANCEIIKAVEKFEVQSLLDAREKAGLV